MTNKFEETIKKIREKKPPIPLDTEEDFEARRKVSEDMKKAVNDYYNKLR